MTSRRWTEWLAIAGSLLCGGIFLWGLWDVLLLVVGRTLGAK